MNLRPQYAPPPKETPATVRDLIDAHIALTELLLQEASLMKAMQIARVNDLQDRKLRLTGLLERYMRYLKAHPEVLSTATDKEKNELRAAGARFRTVMKTNYDTLMVARAVNNSVVKCVTQHVVRKEHNPVYNARGAVTGRTKYVAAPISLALNQTV